MKIVKIAIAGISDILYHNTGVDKVLIMLKENRIHMSTNLGSRADQLYKQKKFRPYYFSMSRVKYGGYGQTMAPDYASCLVLNGRRLKEKFYGQSVDYWGEDWRKAADDDARKTGDKSKRTKYDENEDRIYADKPFIEPLNRYVTEIHIMLSEPCIRNLKKEKLNENDWDAMYQMGKRYREIDRYAVALKIPVYHYDDFQAFRLQNKRRAITGYKSTSGNYIESLNAMFEAPIGTQRESLTEHIRDIIYRVIYTGDWRDFKPAVECDLQNARGGDRAEKMNTDEFIANMRKYKLRDLDDVQAFMANKFSYLK